MAYFECVIGSAASGGSGADLIVTCDSKFAGATITCTDGTNTFTQTCPSSSPYTVTFESIPTGTWTISGVVSGHTYSVTKTITDFTETLNAIPDGATVTPVNDIQTWLHCAGIFDKTYTTISQVLNDGTTVTALIASTNAVDYMARSTTWASSVCANSSAMTKIGANNYCANKLLANSTWRTSICNSTYFESVLNVKVPTMTSNTTPSGQAISTSAQGAYPNYYAFDGNNTTMWSLNGAGQGYIGYMFLSNIKVLKIGYINRTYSGNWAVDTFKIQYSDDGTTWTDATPTAQTAVKDNNMNYLVIPDCGKHKYWNLFILSVSGAIWPAIYTLQFYGRA